MKFQELLQPLSFRGLKGASVVRKDAKWTPPASHWLKISTDGACKLSSGVLHVVVVEGTLMDSGLSIAWKMGVSSSGIETDSREVVNLLEHGTEPGFGSSMLPAIADLMQRMKKLGFASTFYFSRRESGC
ncbi:hypothetical protein V6N13_139943 [Hibiscus sabdariffa]|uniref:RNase H type-1 domain-containing protein n=2 Tax=Hibiscus sabdariffa TaxID=183260 RepID=A0ABR2AMK7_9ROSI